MPLIWSGLPYIRQRKLYSLEMPNSVNFAFSYHIFAQVGPTAHALVRARIHARSHGFLLVSVETGLLPGFHMWKICSTRAPEMHNLCVQTGRASHCSAQRSEVAG